MSDLSAYFGHMGSEHVDLKIRISSTLMEQLKVISEFKVGESVNDVIRDILKSSVGSFLDRAVAEFTKLAEARKLLETGPKEPKT
jgi:hypothetical protein